MTTPTRPRRLSAVLGAAALCAGLPLLGGVPGATAGTAACTGYVGLTFDDGPTPGNTTALLSALTAAGARATMYNVGKNVEANPDLARAQVTAGMWVGNHTWDHSYLTRLSTAEQQAQLASTQAAIEAATGVTPSTFRPPYLDTNDAVRAVARGLGLTEVATDVDSRDWDGASVDQIVAAAARLQAGQVILMHDWPANTVAAIPRIVGDLRGRGLCPGMISPTTGRAVAPDDVPTTTRTATTRTSRATTSHAARGCRATYTLTSSWEGGFQADVTVTNGTRRPAKRWKAVLRVPRTDAVTSVLNGRLRGHTGRVVVTNKASGGKLAAGDSATFAVVGTGKGTGITVSCTVTPAPSATRTTRRTT